MGSGVLAVTVGCDEETDCRLATGWLPTAGLFCATGAGCACAVGMFKDWLHKAHIFIKAISKCRRLLLAAR